MQLLKPEALRTGDRIGIVAASSPVSAADLDRLTGYLGGRGYAVRIADGVLDRTGYLAGSAERRAAGLLRMFGDPEVAMIMPVSGGTGASHLVDMLDYDLIRAHPKLFTGFSDPSVLNNAILAAAGLPSVHGVSGFQFFGWPDVDEQTETDFWDMVSGPITGREVTGDGWRVYRADSVAVSGPVAGGNMRRVAAVAGTRWMPSTSGVILLLEVSPATFDDVDDLLVGLRLSGVFDHIAALVVGAPADWEPGDASTDELVLRCVGGRFPVITGVAFGHQQRKIQFPIGCRVEFDLRDERPVLRYLEDLVTLDH